MSLITPSVITAKTALSTASAVNALQSKVTAPLTTISTQASKSISTAVGAGITGGMAAISSGVPINGINGAVTQLNNAAASAGALAGSAIGTVNSVAAIAKNPVGLATGLASNYLNSALKSITDVFNKDAKSLANGISAKFNSIFTDTNNKQGSTATRQVSDPVNTNLLGNKAPSATGFKVTSSEAGSQAITMSGTSTQFGTNAETMVGTNISTVLNRFKLDNIGGLAKSITNSQATNSIKGLFGTATAVISSVRAIDQTITTAARSFQTGLSGSLSSFIGRTTGITTTTGTNPLNYFISDGKTSLLDQDNNPVDTGGSGVDAGLANTLIEFARIVGCNPDDLLNFNSANEIASLFNMILSMASANGINRIIDNLLGCSFASTLNGQTAINNMFMENVGSNLPMATKAIDALDDTFMLNKDIVANLAVFNTSLTDKHLTQVQNIFDKMDMTVQDAYKVSDMSVGSYDVFDINTIMGSSPSFTGAVFGDKTFSTYTNGRSLDLSDSGIMVFS